MRSSVIYSVLILFALFTVSGTVPAMGVAVDQSIEVDANLIDFRMDHWAVLPRFLNEGIDPIVDIDGQLNESLWDEADIINDFRTAYFEQPVSHTIDYKLAYDQHYLYVGGLLSHDEADSLAKIEIVIRRRPDAAWYYVVEIPVRSTHPQSSARLNTTWNPSLNDLSSDEGRINLQTGVLRATSDDGEVFSVEAAIPIRSIAAIGVQPGDSWEINIIHVHHLYTRPLTSWISIHNSDQWDTGQSRSGGSVRVYGTVVGQGRFGTVFFSRVPEDLGVASAQNASTNPWQPQDTQFTYVDFTRKQLQLTLPSEAALVEDIHLYWQAPEQPWTTLNDYAIHRDGQLMTITFDHGAPLFHGLYKVNISIPDKKEVK